MAAQQGAVGVGLAVGGSVGALAVALAVGAAIVITQRAAKRKGSSPERGKTILMTDFFQSAEASPHSVKSPNTKHSTKL